MKYEIVHRESSLPLVISFQGLRTALLNTSRELPYLYYNLFTQSNFQLNYIFFKDESQCYFHGEYENIVTIIEDYISKHSPSKVITIGQSAGGFNAILIGESILADTVISIAPQIDLDWYSFGIGKREHPRLFNLQNKFKLPQTNLSKLQPFQTTVEYWRPLYGEFDNYHFRKLNLPDSNLIVREFESGHNIGNTIGKDKFKQLIIDSVLSYI